jgi:hypothetical protein
LMAHPQTSHKLSIGILLTSVKKFSPLITNMRLVISLKSFWHNFFSFIKTYSDCVWMCLHYYFFFSFLILFNIRKGYFKNK